MRHLIKFANIAIATVGLAAAAVPVVAQQARTQPGQMMGGGLGMTGDHHGMVVGHGEVGLMMGRSQNHALATFDTNSDGAISPEEMTADVRAEIKTYDADDNGTLSLEEFAVMHAARTRPTTVRAFQMHDPDGDAQVTEAEMAAMAAMTESHSDWQHGDMQGRHRGTMGNN